VTGLATAIGPVVGGVLVQNVGWQSIFLLNVPVGLIGITLSAWAISESYDERAPRTVDLFGLLTSAA
jgi:MFS family permease